MADQPPFPLSLQNLRCREACEHAPNERVRKATLKASMELRVELDRLEEGSEEKAEEG